MKIRINEKVDGYVKGHVYEVDREKGMKLYMDGRASEVDASTPIHKPEKVKVDAVTSTVKHDQPKSEKVKKEKPDVPYFVDKKLNVVKPVDPKHTVKG